MKITTVNYQKVFPLAQYVNEKIGVEIQVDEWDDPAEALQKAKKMVETFHRESNPQLESMAATAIDSVPIPSIQVQKPKDTVSLTIEQINQASDITVLESFKLLASRNPQIKEAYDKRLNELK